jgi:ribosomal protein S18 acetylase RimI-like enzyme
MTVVDDALAPAPAGVLTRLLHDVYVGGGFTAPDTAEELFAEAAVRRRGRVLLAMTAAEEPYAGIGGMVIVVPSASPACRLAQPGEVEMHLLAVAPGARGRGVGAALVAAAVAQARRDRARRMILWTQPAMTAAQRLYARAGFRPVPERDFRAAGRAFSVHELPLDPPIS